MSIDLYPPGNALPSLFRWQTSGFDAAATRGMLSSRGTIEWPWDY